MRASTSGRSFGLATLLMITLSFVSCARKDQPQHPPRPPQLTVQLKRIEVPGRVLSIANEAIAFEATGQADGSNEVNVSLRRWQGRFGEFQRALVFEYDKTGKVLSEQQSNVLPDGAIAIKARGGNRYLIYPDLGVRFNNAYEVACKIQKARIPKTLVPPLCTQIFCTDNIFKASQLKDRVPGLKDQSVEELGDAVIGGFGGTGDICNECLHTSEPVGDFVPARGCSGVLPPYEPPTSSSQILFTRIPPIGAEPFNFQIFKLANGTTTNLSNNEQFENNPDVNHRTRKVVFFSTESGLMTMSVNGTNRSAIPNTSGGGHPVWSRNGEDFIVFITLPGNVDNTIHRIRLDGSGDVLVAQALSDHVIDALDVIDDDHIIFSQFSLGAKSDLFIKDMRANTPPVNITNSPNVDEISPVVSHSGGLIAFQVRGTGGERDSIHVARLTLPSTLTEIAVIRLSDPAGDFVRTCDFSGDDSSIIVSASVIETEGSTNTLQLFSIKLDGTGQVRLTFSDGSDSEATVVP